MTGPAGAPRPLAQREFAAPTPVDLPLVLCYKFGSEPFVLYKALALTVKHLESVSADAALVGATREIRYGCV